jgi:metal-responsive CopG/Arc/MetJ family transcriptional regulator
MEAKMGERKSERVPIMFEPSLLQAIDDFRFDQRIGSRAKAVRRLIETALGEMKETQKADATA